MKKQEINKIKIYVVLAVVLSFVAGMYLGGVTIISYSKSRNKIAAPSNQITYLSGLLDSASEKGNEALISIIAMDFALAVITLNLNMHEAGASDLKHACRVMKNLQPKIKRFQHYLELNNAANTIRPEVYSMVSSPGGCNEIW